MEAVGGFFSNAEVQPPRHTHRGQDADKLKLFVVSKVAIIVQCQTF